MGAAIVERYRAAFAGLPREVWAMALALFVNRCGTMVYPFLTIYFTSSCDLNEATAGMLVGVYGVGSVCGAYLGGVWTERWGAVRVQIVSLVLAAPVYWITPFMHGVYSIGAALFTVSLLTAAVRPANATAIARLTDRANRARAFALQRLAANLGFSFGPAIGGWLAAYSYGLLFLVDGVTTLLGAVCLWHFFGWTLLPVEDADEPCAARGASPLRDAPFAGYLALLLLGAIVFFQFGTTFPLYLRDRFAMSKPQIGMFFAVNTLTIVAFEMVLLDAVKNWRLIRTIAVGTILSCVGFGILPWGASGAFCVGALLVVTVGEMLSMPLGAAFVSQRAPDGHEARYLGWNALTFSLGSVLGPTLGAALYAVRPEMVWYA
ncbi:MAG: MFS transporter, partial [Planctomycetales bacterium]|nr:MFS transporter [Planctomycetales bacterium]